MNEFDVILSAVCTLLAMF